MINKTARDYLEEAGVEHRQADAIATVIPDWTLFATKQEVQSLRRWMIGGFVTLAVLPDNWIAQVLEWISQST